MNESKPSTAPATSRPPAPTKPAATTGFLGRLVRKLDDSLKSRAAAQARSGSSCCGGQGRGGKCC